MADTPRIAELRKKIDKDPGSRLFAQLAEELRKEGQFDEAIAVARKGLEKNPNYPSARLTIARALLDSRRPGDARAELEQVVKASPDNIMASRLLGDALDDLGESAKALHQYEQTLKLAPGDKALLERIGEVNLRLRAAAYVAPEAAPEPVATLPEVAAAPVAAEPDSPPAPPVGEALDRDLASGTFRPGVFDAADLAGIREPEGGAGFAPPREAPTAFSVPDVDATVGFGELGRSAMPSVPSTDQVVVATLPPAIELPVPTVPAEPPMEIASAREAAPPAVAGPEPRVEEATSDVGAQTIPLNSITLADLYLQQGLQAEANEVLREVLKAEPDNIEARARLAVVSAPQVAAAQPPPAISRFVPAPPAAPMTSVFSAALPVAATPSGEVRPRRTAKDIRTAQIASLTAFRDATEREAAQQRATPQGQGAVQ